MLGALQSQPLANFRGKGDCPPLGNGYCSHAAILQYGRSFVKFSEEPIIELWSETASWGEAADPFPDYHSEPVFSWN
jgi:hypothetical protein